MFKPMSIEMIQKANSSNLEGCDGRCYIDNDKVIKIYKNPKNIHDLCDLSSYSSPMISFPYYYLTNGSKQLIMGEVMPYFDKLNIFKSLTYATNIKLLIDYYYKLIYEVKKYPEIIMEDMFYGNIWYNEESGFSLIDTFCWCIRENKNFSLTNISLITNSIHEIIMKDYLELNQALMTMYYDSFKQYGPLGEEFYKLALASVYNGDHFVELVELFQELAEKVLGKKTESLFDLKKNMKMLKKH